MNTSFGAMLATGAMGELMSHPSLPNPPDREKSHKSYRSKHHDNGNANSGGSGIAATAAATTSVAANATNAYLAPTFVPASDHDASDTISVLSQEDAQSLATFALSVNPGTGGRGKQFSK
jgi:hypothetical protein